MKILFLASEVVPLAKTGGLADVAGALPPALKQRGHEVIVFLPKYRPVKASGVETKDTGIKLSIPVGDSTIGCSIEKTFLPSGEVPVYLVVSEPYYGREGLYQEGGEDYPDNLERYTLFCRAALESLKEINFQPDVIHCNDWQTALVPIYLKTIMANDPFFGRAKTLYTIHNLGYQGIFPKESLPLTGLGWDQFTIDRLEYYDSINLMKGAIVYADRLSTVSQKYSEEIQTTEFGFGLEGVLESRKDVLTGILNGADYSSWNPETDALIPATYSTEDLSGKAKCKEQLQKEYTLPQKPDIPVLGVISRLADQKGFDVLVEMFDYLMALPVQFVLLGTGPKYHSVFEKMAQRFPHKCGIALKFDNRLAHLIEAGSDLFLMPSRYEPCGLNQMYSLKYGTLPVVRATGGLADTVKEFDPLTGEGNGFVFEDPDPKEFFWAIYRGIQAYEKKDTWKRLMKRAMLMDFSWDVAAGKYIGLYRSMTGSV